VSFTSLAALGAAGYNPWNGPHCIENAGQANSYSRDQLTGVIAQAAARKSRYLRFPVQFGYHFRAPETLYPGNLIDWFCYTCFTYGIIPAPILFGAPDVNVSAWNALLPADGRWRHNNHPEQEMESAILDCNDEVLAIVAAEAARAGCSQSLVPILNGNEKGKGGSGDLRPYTGQTPANPYAADANGKVPARIVSFTAAQLTRIRAYNFIAVSPALEAETTTIMQTEIDSTGWKAVLSSHDKIAIHCYPELAGTTLGRGYASYAQATAYKARRDVLINNDITLPVWVTECGWVQSTCSPTSSSAVADSMARTCKRLGAEEAFPFVLVMEGVTFAVYVKTDLTATAPTWPGA